MKYRYSLRYYKANEDGVSMYCWEGFKFYLCAKVREWILKHSEKVPAVWFMKER